MEMDWTQYWFMFPVAMCVATAAMLSGIGGAAMFIPIFVVVFPLLGPEYPLGTAAAIGSALVTMVFGFSSGFIGYYRKRLIDFRSAVPFFLVSVPVAIAGAMLLAALKQQESLLQGAYAVLMLALCPLVLRRTPALVPASPATPTDDAPTRTLTDRDGRSYSYRAPRPGLVGAGAAGLGALLTGLLGVGIGEVIMPLLVKRYGIPVAVAAATSVFVVIVTIAAASFTQIAALTAAGGFAAIPWNLICYTVPGVIIGGQLGPWLQGRIAPNAMEKGVAALLAAIGTTMGWIALRGWL